MDTKGINVSRHRHDQFARFHISGSGFKISGSGFQVPDFGLRVSGSRFWVAGFGDRPLRNVPAEGDLVCGIDVVLEPSIWS